MQLTNPIQRILTAIALGPLVILGVLALPTGHFSLALGAVTVAGAWEWAGLAPRGADHWPGRAGYCLATGLLLYPALRWETLLFPTGWLALSILGLAWWCVALVRVARFEKSGGGKPDHGSIMAHALVGWLILLPFWGALVAIHRYPDMGPLLVILLMALIWGADSGAYFVGRHLGRRRLCPRTSPGKSWEGAAGGLLVSGALSTAAGILAGLSPAQIILLVLLSMITVMLSILGDITESLFKRRSGKKDSGNLLPGHGGILDRIDSLTAAAPFFAVAVYFMEFGQTGRAMVFL